MVEVHHRGGHIVVTGGAGYIGSHLVQALTRHQSRVIVIDNGQHAPQTLSPEIAAGSCQLLQEDVRNVEATREAYQGCSAVYHLAAIVGAANCEANRDLSASINVDGSRIVASLAAAEGASSFFLASTCSVYGASSEVLDESSPVAPSDYYAETKVTAEHTLRQFASEMDVIILRFGTAFGLSRRMRPELLVTSMTRDAHEKRTITVRGPERWRPFVHCKDIAAACALFGVVGTAPKPGCQVVNIGASENNFRLGDVARIVQSLVPNSQITVDVGGADTRDYRVSFAQMHTFLNWKPPVSLYDGVAETVAWIQAKTSCPDRLGV